MIREPAMHPVRRIVGVGGSAVSRAGDVARELAVSLETATGLRHVGAEDGGRVAQGGMRGRIRIDARDYLLPAAAAAIASGWRSAGAVDDPGSYDSKAFAAAAASLPGDAVVLCGPLLAVPGVRDSLSFSVLVDVEERLLLLRWADALMDAGAPGGVEALELYSGVVEPGLAKWRAGPVPGIDLVLDDDDGVPLLVQKVLWLLDRRRSPSVPAEGAEVAREATSRPGRLDAIREMEARFSRPVPAAGPGLSASLRILAAERLYPAAKRAIDVVLVSVLLMVVWPVFALVAFLVWLDDPGPVLYTQTRIGLHGRPFPFPKFRSMVRNADKLKDLLLAKNEMQGGITFKMKRDPRIIPIGFVMRKYSLDELPQLWSILRGHLSLVGPRPPVPREVALYTASDRRRLDAVPGLTCIWQVSGRSEIPFPRQVELDVEYLESRSLLLDLRLLLATIPGVITGKGAY